jgi:hypothetical protein
MGLLTGRVVAVGDVPVLFKATDPTRAEALERFLAGFASNVGPEDASVRLGARLPAMPRRRADHVVDGFDLWTAGPTMHVDLAPTARATANESTALVGVTDEAALRSFPVAFLFVATHLLALRDRFLIHAGAVVHRGRAYVVVGESGMGKSTLIGAALGSDWKALADDMTVLRSDGPHLAATGIRRPIAVPAEVTPSVGAELIPGDPRRRRVVLPTALESGWFPVAGLIAVGHAASSTGHLTPLAGQEALRLVLRSFTSVANPDLLRRFFGSAAALSRLPGWRLEHGADPATRLESARRLLDGVLAGWGPRP